MPLALSNLRDPLFWAVFIGWILSVILHEFCHGLVAWIGGDYTIRERGGLSLNPLQYVDPVMSLIMPMVLLLMGGVPLPGGATYVRDDLLRNKFWKSAVSAAGPLSNLLLFFACAIPLHPYFGWVDTSAAPDAWSNGQIVLGSLAVLQFFAVILNLVPIPPLDGFGMISPLLSDDLRGRLGPPVSTFLFIGFFIVLWQTPGLVTDGFHHLFAPCLEFLGFRYNDIEFFRRAFNMGLYGGSS